MQYWLPGKSLARNSRTVSSARDLLSSKSIKASERLIVALDVPTNEEALDLIDALGDAVGFYKVGLELIIGGRYVELVDHLVQKLGKKVMLDGKFFDVPATVQAAVRQAAKHRVTFATVHGNDKMLRAAVAAKGESMEILAVTVLTSLDDGDLKDLGFQVKAEELVLSRARRALEMGCAGVVSSGLEAPALRRSFENRVVIVTPGIRPVANVDDQKRTVNVEQAFTNGADYIVVGRPITRKADPGKAAAEIQQTIAGLFPGS